MLEGVATDDLVTNVHAATGDLANLVDEIRGSSVIDGEVCADILADLQLFGTTGNGDHGRALCLGQVDSCGADTASGSGDQNGFAGL